MGKNLDFREEKNVAYLLTYLDIIDDAIVGLTSDFKICFWSKGAERELGYSSAEIMNKNLIIIIPEDKLEDYKSKISEVKNGHSIYNFETTRIHKNGTIVDVSISLSPIFDDEGIQIGALGIYKDISDLKLTKKELKEHVQELEKLKKEAEDANKAKSQFLANITHGIRTPLNGIHGLIQLLDLSNDKVEREKYIGMLKEATLTLESIINDILDLEKIESGTLELKYESFDIRKMINNLYNHLVIMGNSKRLEIGYYLDPDIAPKVIGDELKLKQILTNLIHNAIKFTDYGFVTLRVNLIVSNNDYDEIEFVVKDSGLGIQEDTKNKLFHHFIQGSMPTSKKYEGTGLGLAISKQLANLMDAEIWFESTFGKGSTFYFKCKFQKPTPTVEKEVIESENKKEEIDSLSTNGITILCVEDNIINQEVLGGIIKRKGFNYIPAHNGKEALNKLKDNKVDLIVMDIQLPELNGYETAKIIRAEESLKHIPIIAITAYALLADREKCLEAGMNDYISKPIDIDKFYKLLNQYLG